VSGVRSSVLGARPGVARSSVLRRSSAGVSGTAGVSGAASGAARLARSSALVRLGAGAVRSSAPAALSAVAAGSALRRSASSGATAGGSSSWGGSPLTAESSSLRPALLAVRPGSPSSLRRSTEGFQPRQAMGSRLGALGLATPNGARSVGSAPSALSGAQRLARASALTRSGQGAVRGPATLVASSPASAPVRRMRSSSRVPIRRSAMSAPLSAGVLPQSRSAARRGLDHRLGHRSTSGAGSTPSGSLRRHVGATTATGALPGSSRAPLLESSRTSGSTLHRSVDPLRLGAQPATAAARRPETRWAVQTVASPAALAAAQMASVRPAASAPESTSRGSVRRSPAAHSGMPLRRSSAGLVHDSSWATDGGRATSSASTTTVRRSVNGAGARAERGPVQATESNSATALARRTRSAMNTAPMGAAAATAGAAASATLRRSAVGSTGVQGSSSSSGAASPGPSFLAARPRPGAAVGPVTRRSVASSDRPMGWSAALAGVQAARRQEASVASSTPASAPTVRRARMSSTGATAGRRTTVRRSPSTAVARRADSGLASAAAADGSWNAGDMAARLERGEQVPTQIERIRRSVSGETAGQATIRRSVPERAPEPPAPDSPAGMLGAGSISTSRLLDIQGWITGLVEERLALELERRGLSGDRW
jgi:hypothetical protein